MSVGLDDLVVQDHTRRHLPLVVQDPLGEESGQVRFLYVPIRNCHVAEAVSVWTELLTTLDGERRRRTRRRSQDEASSVSTSLEELRLRQFSTT
jgi:hypothetical protein